MNPLLVLALLLGMAGVAGCVIVIRRSGANPPAPKWLLILLPLSAAMMLWMSIVWIMSSPYDEWNGARVAPVLAWTMGMPLYFPAGHGPASAFMYPPVSAILRLPVALTSTPNAAIILSSVINAITFFAPLGIYVFCLRGRRVLRAIALLLAWGMTLNVDSLIYSAFKVHADASAVGFALLGCACLTRRGRRGTSMPMLLLASACAVLSVGSKQTTAPVLILLPLFAGLRHGARAGIIMMIVVIAMLGAGAAIAIGAFGFEPLRYNLWDLAVRQPWWFEDLGVAGCLFLWSGTLLKDSAAPAIAIGVLWFLSPPVRTRSMRTWLARNPWVLPLTIAIVLTPFSIIGVAKRGGQQNALTLTSYFLVAALAGMIARLRPRASQRPIVGATAMLAIALAILAVCPFTQKLSLVRELSGLSDNPQMQAYRYAALHPGQVYFPRHPLAGLLVDGKYYLFEYGWGDQIAAGEDGSPQRMLPWLPPGMQMVAFPPSVGDLPGRMEVPGFTQRVEIADLPGWFVFTRPGRSYSAP